jgi:hypothetical protein
MKKNNGNTFWIENIFNKNKYFDNRFFSIVFISLPGLILFIPFIIFKFNIILTYPPKMIFGLSCGLIWVWLGPYWIFSYTKKLKNVLLSIKENYATDKTHFKQFEENCLNNFFKIKICTPLWILLVVFAAIWDENYLCLFGIGGINDPYFYVFILLLSYLLYITSIGFSGIITTIKLTLNLISENVLKVDYFHSDGNGGLKFIKDLIYSTTKLFSTAVLFIPILLHYITYTKNVNVKLLLYFLIIIASISIVLSFFVPLKRLNTYAENKKDKDLLYYSRLYQKHFLNCISNDYNESIKEELRTLNLYNFIILIKDIKLYKMATSDTWLQILFAILIPLAGFFINSKDILGLLEYFTK